MVVLLSYFLHQMCITPKGDRMSSSENQCMNQCIDRYFDVMNTVTRVLSKH